MQARVFAPFWSENGYMVFEGLRERKRNIQIRNGFEYFFCLCSNLGNGNIISAYGPGLKTVWILEVWSEKGCGKLHFLV